MISETEQAPSRESFQPAVIAKLREIQHRQQQPGYWASDEDKDLLKFLVLEQMEPFCSELIPDGYPSKNEQYWIWREGGKTFNVSLTTGRFFLEETGDKGAGDVFLLWREIKNVFFVDALTGITEWLLKRTSKNLRASVAVGEEDLRRLVWYAIDKAGKRNHEKCSREFWKIVRAEYGVTTCARIYPLSSPERFRDLLSSWVGTGKITPLFAVTEKRWENQDRKRKRVTKRVAFCLTRSGVPCSCPPEPEVYRELGLAILPE